MRTPTRARFLMVGFDGLRPDLVSPGRTPNIVRLQNMGVTLTRHRSVYPSETRVVFPSFVTGAPPQKHGMVGNRFLQREADGSRLHDTASPARLEELDRLSDGGLMTAVTLGEILAENGLSLAVLATNSGGATRILDHKARKLGHICISGHFPDVSTPSRVIDEISRRLGPPPPPPPQGTPDLDGQAYIVDAFLGHVWPGHRPDVSLLWFSEPDLCNHFNGIGALETESAIAFADRQLGRILDWWEADGRDEGVQLLVVSDHGHITGHTRVSVIDALTEAGFSSGSHPDAGLEAVVVPGQVGAIYLVGAGRRRLSEAVAVISEMSWCGPIFTAPRSAERGVVTGTLASSLVMADHARAPDIYFAFRADDSVDAYGLVGGTYYDNPRPSGLGVHGGLHPHELNCLCVAAGTLFRDGGLSSITPSGVCDIAPTILAGIGISPPATMTGRVLAEVLMHDRRQAPLPRPEPEIFEARLGNYHQAVRRVRIGHSIYLEGGWAGSDALAAAHSAILR